MTPTDSTRNLHGSMTASLAAMSYDARTFALAHRRHLRREARELEARRAALRKTIKEAEAELSTVNESLASTVGSLSMCAKPSIKLADDTEAFDMPMGAEDIVARVTPSPVKQALKQSWEFQASLKMEK